MLGCATLALAGCGAKKSATPLALQLERGDLVAVAQALSGQASSVDSEVAATKAAWPLIANGLPADGTISHPAIRTAIERAATLRLPELFGERQAPALTGPSSPRPAPSAPSASLPRAAGG